MPVAAVQELWATEILRLRSGVVEWTEDAPAERGWYWFAKKPDPESIFRHRTHPGVKLVEARFSNGGTRPLYIEGGAFLFEDDVKGARWSKVTIPTSPFEVANG